MVHSFDTDIAEKYGVLEAIMINNFAYWIKFNEANEKNYHDGRYWTFNTLRSLEELFKYSTKSSINRALTNLCEQGILLKGNYNKDSYDRTMWYAFSDEGMALISKNIDNSPFSKNEKCISQNGKWMSQIGTTIPYSNTDIKKESDISKDISLEKESSNRFKKPTLDEVRAYCDERNNGIDAEEFIAFYDSKGWMVGKNKMKSWKSAIVTWEKNREKNVSDKKDYQKSADEIMKGWI